MSLSEKSKGALVGILVKEAVKPIFRKLGDRMARGKPFWRAVVGFFRSRQS